jgi:hypothetical protein
MYSRRRGVLRLLLVTDDELALLRLPPNADPVELVQPFGGANLQALNRRLARVRAAHRSARDRGHYEPDPPKPGRPPLWRTEMAETMPYPQARISHLDGPLRERLDQWLNALIGEQPELGAAEPGNLILPGPAGTGKTVAACALATLLADQHGFRVGYTRVSDLIADERPEGTRRLRGRLARCDAVVLDDLLAVRLTEWAQDTLTDVVDGIVHQRNGSGAVLIVTTNVPTDELGEQLPERLWSRIVAQAWTVNVLGEDRRGETLEPVQDEGRGPCPHGCSGGVLLVSPEDVDRLAGGEASPSTVAAAANSVRPCPFCRGKRAE